MIQSLKFATRSLVVLAALLGAVTAYAETNQLITYQGRILRPDGTPLEGNIVFTVKIYSPSPSSCLLWAESQTLPMVGSMGAFSLQIGRNGNRMTGANGGGAGNFNQTFINNPSMTINSGECQTGNSYTPNLTDDRVMNVTFSDNGQQIKVADMPIKSVPFAMQAEQIGGYSVNYLFKIAGTAQAGDKTTGLFSRDAMNILHDLAHLQDFGGNTLKNIGAPAAGTDAANKDYVDNAIGSMGTSAISVLNADLPLVVSGTGTTRTLSLGTSGVAAAMYGTEVMVPQITVDQWGRITFAEEKAIPLASAAAAGLVQIDTTTGLTINSGTLGLALPPLDGSNFGSQAQNTVFAAPSGGAGNPTFRTLDQSDIPVLTAAGKVENSATTATSTNTPNAIITRGSTGSFAANDATLNSLTLDNGFGSTVSLRTPTALTPYTLTLPVDQGQADDILTVDALGNLVWKSPSASGAVTLVDLAVPGELAVTGGPIASGAGTLSVSWNTQTPNLVFASPTGAVGAPGFRALEASDIPNLDTAKLTSGTLGVDRGGTGLVPAAGDANKLYGINAAGDNGEYKTVVAGSGVTIDLSQPGTIGISATGMGGTVFNIGAVVPSFMTVSPSAVTTSGTFDFSFNSQTANMVFAAPTGGGAPDFRLLEPSDIPALDTAKLTSGTLGVDRGGTGLVPGGAGDANKVYGLDAAGTGSEFKSIVAGSGVAIDLSQPGSISISAMGLGGTVTHVGAGTGLLGGPITDSGTLSIDVGVSDGQIVQVGTGDKIAVSLLPDHSTDLLTTGTLGVDRGGTGLVPTAGDANKVYGINAAGDNGEYKSVVAGSGVVIDLSQPGTIGISATGLGGTVFNVGAVVPSYMTVSPAAITSSGTFDFSFNSQTAAFVFAAPTGAAGAPTFRALAATDIPDLDTAKLTSGTLGADRGGTGHDASTAANGQLLIGNGSGFSLNTLTAGSGINITNTAGSISISSTLAGGTVTNVGITAPTSVFSVANSPVTSAGTMDLSFNSQASGLVLASPTGASGEPSFRALAASDIPSLDTSKLTTGTLGVDRGGTGLVPVVGDANKVYGINAAGDNGEYKSVVAGSGVVIDLSQPGTIGISATGLGGTVFNVGAVVPSYMTVSPGAITSSGTFDFSFNTQNAGFVFAAPTGASGAPEFRALAASDIPFLDASHITTGTLGVDRGGTGIGTLTPNALLMANGTGSAVISAVCTPEQVMVWKLVGGWVCEDKIAGAVTLVDMVVPSIFNLTGGPINSAGTFDVTLASQNANMVFAAPTGGSGTPSFRALAASDIPNLDASKITGTLGTANGGTGLDTSSATDGQLLIGNGSGFSLNTLTAGSGINITNAAGSISISSTLAGGTVTNVGLTAPTSVFSIANSPVTGAGTMDITFTSQTAAFVFAAPTGSAGAPLFRALAATDIPSLDTSILTTGTLGTDRGGTGLVPAGGNAHQFYAVNGTGTGAEFKTIVAGTGVTLVPGTGSLVISATGSGGTVTNVGLVAPTSIFSVTDSPVTGAGTMSIDFVSQLAGMVFAAPTGSAGAPVFRALASSDIPNLDAAKITSGTLAVERGGTGLNGATAASGQLLIGTGTGFTLNTLTAGSGINITNSAGSISISSTLAGGTVTNVGLTAPTSVFTIANSPVTGAGTMDISFASQSAALVFASPTGASGAPVFRALAATDVPNLDISKLTSGTLGIDRGGTGLSAGTGNANQLFGINAAGTAGEFKSLVAGTGLSIAQSNGTITLSAGSGTATQWTDIAKGIHYSSGSVGIGTTDPGSMLDVQSSAQTTIQAVAANSTASQGPMFLGSRARGNLGAQTYPLANDMLAAFVGGNNISQLSPAGMLILASETHSASNWGSEIMFQTVLNGNNATTTRMTITNDGLVGIGTQDPTAALDIIGTSTLDSAIRIPRATTANRPTGTDLVGMMRYNTDLSKYEVYEGTTGWASLSTGSVSLSNLWAQGGNSFGQTGTLGTNDNNALAIRTYGTTRISVLSNGNVGIGDTNPSNILSISGNDNGSGSNIALTNSSTGPLATAHFQASNSGNLRTYVGITSTGFTPTWLQPNEGYLYSSATNGLHIATNTNNRPIKFSTGSTTSPTEKMRITHDGLVGIGTITPTAALDITATGTLASAIRIPRDTAATRPVGNAAALVGMMRYNTDSAKYEVYEATGGWLSLSTGSTGASQWTNVAEGIHYSSGSVGIGVASPQFPLHVAGGALIATDIEFSEAFGHGAIIGNGFKIGVQGGAHTFNYLANLMIGDYSAPLAALGVTGNMAVGAYAGTGAPTDGLIVSGLVGVGTPSPTVAFEVASTGTTSAIRIPRAPTAMRPTGGSASALQGLLRYNTDLSKYEVYEGTTGWVSLSTGSTGASQWNNVARGINYAGGSVGIGVATPLQRFHVEQSTNEDLVGLFTNTQTGYGTYLSLQSTSLFNGIGMEGTGTDWFFGMNGTTAISLVDKANSDQVPFAVELNTPTNTLKLASSGLVGIGTASPTAALDIVGTGTLNSAIRIPRATAATRPVGNAAALVGMMRYNTDSAKYEVYEATGGWLSLSTGSVSLSNMWAQGGNSFNQTGTLGTNDNFNLHLRTNGANRVTIDTSGNVAMTGDLSVVRSDAQTSLEIGNTSASASRFPYAEVYNYMTATGGGYPEFRLNNRRGNGGAPTAVQSGDVLGQLRQVGSYAASYALHDAASIRFVAEENFAAGNAGTNMQFMTSNLGQNSMSEKMRISANGLVGIGTGSPSAALDVVGTGTLNSAIRIPRATAATRPVGNAAALVGMMRYNTDSAKYEVYEATGGWLSLSTGSTGASQWQNIAKGINYPAGSIGVGNATPSSIFEIEDPDYWAPAASIGNFGLYTSAAMQADRGASIAMGGNNGSGTRTFVTLSGRKENATSGNDAGYFSVHTRDTASSMNERLRITSAGLVGLGTDTPTAALDIVGTGTLNSAIRIPRATAATRPVGNAAALVGMMRYNTDSAKYEVYEATGGWLSLSTGSTGASQWTNVARGIHYSSGSVGIGTATPSSSLHVQSTNTGTASYEGTAFDLTYSPTSVASFNQVAAASGSATGTGANLASSNLYGGTFESILNGSSNLNYGTGVQGVVANWSSNSMNGALGVYGWVQNTSSGQIATAVGVDAEVTNSGSGTTTTAYGVRAKVDRTAGAITTGYGVYIDSVDATTKYGLYQADATAASYFAGKVGVGTNAPTTGLDIATTGTLASAIRIPRDSTANRPTGGNAAALVGMMRYNTDLSKYEVYEGSTGWTSIATGASSSKWSNISAGIAYNSGSVAIGTTTPNSIFGIQTPTSNYGVTHSNGTVVVGTWVGHNNGIGVAGQFGTRTNHNLGFFTYDQDAQITLQTNGNVGIGTTTPTVRLDIAGTGTLSSAIRIPRDGTSNRPVGAASDLQGMMRYNTDLSKYEVYEGTTGWVSLSSGTAGASQWTNATNGITYNSGGSVGIGVANPAAKFHIYGTSDMDMPGSINTANALMRIGENAGVLSLDGNSIYTNAYLALGNTVNQSLFLATNGQSRFEITGSGQIYTSHRMTMGSTTSYPGAILALDGTGTIASSIILPRDSTAARPVGQIGMMRYNTTLSKYEVYESTGWASIATGTSASQWSDIALGINYASGSVGIGAATPTYRFEVAGPIASKEPTPMIVTQDTTSAKSSTDMTGGIYMRDSANSLAGQLAFDSGDSSLDLVLGIDAGVNGGLRFLTQGTNQMILSGRGLLGIGTTTPTAALDVVATGTLGSAIRFPRATTAMRPVGNAAALQGMMRYNTDLSKYEVYEGTTGWVSLATGAGSSQWNTVAKGISFSSGSVGIGTTAPSGPLHVVGGSIAAATVNAGTMTFKGDSITSGSDGLIGGGFVFQGGTGTDFGRDGPFIYRNAGGGDMVELSEVYGHGRLNIYDASGTTTTEFYANGSGYTKNNFRVGSPDEATNALDVSGGATVGLNWGENVTAPTNGLYVKGSMGVGIATPSEKLHVNGNVLATAYLYSSDRTLKKDIQPVEGLAKILRLNGKTFKWRSNGTDDVGLIAQEVEEVFPQLVKTDANTGKKAVQYGNLVAPLIEATKELYGMCQASEEQLARLESQLQSHGRDIASLKEDSARKDAEIEELKRQNEMLKEAVCGLNPSARICQP